MLRDAVLVAVLVLPIALVRHLLRGQHFGFYVVAGLCALPVLGIVLKLGTSRKDIAGESQRHGDRG
jgi:O-antigen ligase